jgi:hypothetical protein
MVPPCLSCPSPAAEHYWLFHSVWHLLLAEGYHSLYQQLEGEHMLEDSESATDEQLAVVDGAGDVVVSSGVQQEGPAPHQHQREQEQGGGWVHSLLQPWERLVRYQRQQQLDGQQWWRRQQPSSKKGL